MKKLGKVTLLSVGISVLCGNAYGEITALDESVLSEVTGQAGLSIEVDNAEITMGEFRYQDQGSIAVRDIRLGGADKVSFFGNQWLPLSEKSDKLDNIKIDVDVLADGDLTMVMKPSGSFSVVDFALTTGEWVLQDSLGNDGTRLVSSLNLTGLGIDARIRVDNQTSHTFIETTFGVDDLDVDFEFLGVRLENAQIAGTSYLETIGTWGYGNAGISDIGAEFDLELYSATSASGNTALGVNINKFQADILLPEIYLGSTPSIGQVTLNNVDITAQLVVYGH